MTPLRTLSCFAVVLTLLLPGCSDSEPEVAAAAAAERIGLAFAAIPAGEFRMGASPDEIGSTPRERPVHTVSITQDFSISRTEVTVAQFTAFVDATGYVTEAEEDPKGGWRFVRATGTTVQDPAIDWRNPGYPQTPDHPVVQVSWVDAEAFCQWLGSQDGRTYRLPTEAEWEYACRAGTTTRFSFGDDASALPKHANVADGALADAFPAVGETERWHDDHPFTAPVGQFEPNAWGLFDMHGNVWEWCSDWHDDGYPALKKRTNPTGPLTGKIRAIRGGGWYDPSNRARSATRAWFFPVFRYCQLSGFRVVRES